MVAAAVVSASVRASVGTRAWVGASVHASVRGWVRGWSVSWQPAGQLTKIDRLAHRAVEGRVSQAAELHAMAQVRAHLFDLGFKEPLVALAL